MFSIVIQNGKGTLRVSFLFCLSFCGEVEGRVLENSPVDCFPAPPLRPQTGDSPHLHHSRPPFESFQVVVFFHEKRSARLGRPFSKQVLAKRCFQFLLLRSLFLLEEDGLDAFNSQDDSQNHQQDAQDGRSHIGNSHSFRAVFLQHRQQALIGKGGQGTTPPFVFSPL